MKSHTLSSQYKIGGCSGFIDPAILATIVVSIVVIYMIAFAVIYCRWRKRKNQIADAAAYEPTETKDDMFPVKQGASTRASTPEPSQTQDEMFPVKQEEARNQDIASA